MTTIAQRVRTDMAGRGYRFLGQTSGSYSFRKGSNLSKYLLYLGKKESEVVVKTGARAGRMKNDGYQLLVFEKGNLE